MLRISSTTVESFRLCCQTDWKPEAELIASIRGEFQRTWQMDFGVAWHDCLENCVTESGGYRFREDDVEYAVQLSQGMPEVKVAEPMTIDGQEVTVVGKCDYILGTEIADHKTKVGGTWNPQDYEHSLQWRMYLWLFGASSFTYHGWMFSEPRQNRDIPAHNFNPDSMAAYYAEQAIDAAFIEGEVYRLRDHAWVRFWPYPSLEEDCREWLGRFLAWLKSRRLTACLERAA